MTNSEHYRLAVAWAAYNSASGRATKRGIELALGLPLDILRSMCAARNLSA